MTSLKRELSAKMEIMLQKLLKEMRNMKETLKDVDRRVRTQEITKQLLFNPIGQHYEGSGKTTFNAIPSHFCCAIYFIP